MPPGFATIWTSVALDLVGFGIVFPILPLYAKRFRGVARHRDRTGGGVRRGPVRVLAHLGPGLGSRRPQADPVLSLAGTAVGSLLTGLAGGVALLFLGRIIDGISGASVSVAQASVSDVAPPEQRARLFGLLGAAFGIGFVAGPALGALAALGGARLPFFLAAALAGVNALVAVRRLPETHRPGACPAASGAGPAGRRRVPRRSGRSGGSGSGRGA